MNPIHQWFSAFFFTCAPHWQPIPINCTHNIGRMFVINMVAAISNLSCHYTVDMCLFPPLFNFFSRIPLNDLFRTPGSTRAPGWGSLPYMTKFGRHGFTECITFVERIPRVARGLIYTVTERGTAPSCTCPPPPASHFIPAV